MPVELKLPPSDDWVPTLEETPYHKLGGDEAVRALAYAFYDAMDAHEPALAKLHELDAQGRVNAGTRERFGLFLVGWLGGPQHYMERHGHPRLRMRHGHLPVDTAMRDAWVRSMQKALDARGITGGLRRFLDARFAQVADFLRNTEG
ncbi:group II truncated hemoglobin [Pyxidicoccus xibeiensis]|uniref:group II truncated hemoglobin n=1 Tax=Pyxidicoccus xibeiensis TaxID=2906759 RepID=UPI0020A80F58|nr:group II truncated hemoglobin [Pyxidicoccus xibeiensis]MCP3136597.1 group II truncated hemoglobin [Pyxidicoccus xibeiensis]